MSFLQFSSLRYPRTIYIFLSVSGGEVDFLKANIPLSVITIANKNSGLVLYLCVYGPHEVFDVSIVLEARAI